jgi:hypothetical protein
MEDKDPKWFKILKEALKSEEEKKGDLNEH